jgi:RNA polymerase sigma factor (sigma-70 family)
MMLRHKNGTLRHTSTEVDTNLIHRCICGEEDAWTHLVNRYERLIFSIALSICRDRDVAADILQQVCLELYQRLDEVRNLSSLTAWVATVSRRKTYSHLRSVRPAESLSDDTPVSAANIFANIERQHELERGLATLSDRDRRLMELLYMSSEGPSYAEISRQLDMPVASIGPTRIRCLKKLKKCMAESHVDSH